MKWICRDPKANAFQAASRFADELGRRIDQLHSDGRFQLEDGVRWYCVRMTRDGWEVSSEEDTQ